MPPAIPARFSIFYRRNLLATLREREVMGVVQGGSVSWQLGKQRGLGR
jgi:hypothetical protein